MSHQQSDSYISHCPPVPNVNIGSVEVEKFLTNFDLALALDLTQEEATKEAREVQTDGKGLYETSKKDWARWRGEHGYQGIP